MHARGFMIEVPTGCVNRLCQDPVDWRADCSGYPVFDPSSDEEVDERFKFLMGPVGGMDSSREWMGGGEGPCVMAGVGVTWRGNSVFRWTQPMGE